MEGRTWNKAVYCYFTPFPNRPLDSSPAASLHQTDFEVAHIGVAPPSECEKYIKASLVNLTLNMRYKMTQNI